MTQQKREAAIQPVNLETAVAELRTESRVRFEGVDRRLEQVDKDIRELRGDMSTLKYSLVSATVLILVAVIGSAIVF